MPLGVCLVGLFIATAFSASRATSLSAPVPALAAKLVVLEAWLDGRSCEAMLGERADPVVVERLMLPSQQEADPHDAQSDWQGWCTYQ